MPFLKRSKADGYGVSIYYFSLADAQLAVRRVKLRVSLGGHAVPADVVRRRFGRSLTNFMTLYAPLASRWAVFDNSSSTAQARLIAAQDGDKLDVKEATPWLKLKDSRKASDAFSQGVAESAGRLGASGASARGGIRSKGAGHTGSAKYNATQGLNASRQVFLLLFS